MSTNAENRGRSPAGAPSSAQLTRARPRPWPELAVLLAVLLAVAVPYVRAAFLNLDDYRFLAQLASGSGSSLLVENRWDDTWWIADGTFVRFLRPFNLPLYALDHALWGLDARGFLATNLALHALATLLLFAFLRRAVGGRVGPLLGAAAFAAHAGFAEFHYFAAGRQGLTAGVFALVTLLVFLRWREGRAPLFAVPLALFLALCAKEYSVVLLPLLVLLDRALPAVGEGGVSPASRSTRSSWRAVLHGHARLWIGCALALALYLALRTWALGEGGSGARPFPYFFLPGREGFAERTGAVLWQYACGLATGSGVRPFLGDAATFFGATTALERVAGVALPLALLLWGLRTPLGRWFAAWTLLALLPLLPVYSTGRYLYLPAMGWCGLIALAAHGSLTAPGAWSGRRGLGLAAALALAVLPATRHGAPLASLPTTAPQRPTRPERLQALFADAGAALPERPVYLLDFPGMWLEWQFAGDVLSVNALAAGRRVAPVRVLTQLPFEPAPLTELRRVGPAAIELARGGTPLHQGDPAFDFDPRPVTGGETLVEPTYRVDVLAAEGGRALRVRVTFDRPLEELLLLAAVFDPATRTLGLRPALAE